MRCQHLSQLVWILAMLQGLERAAVPGWKEIKPRAPHCRHWHFQSYFCVCNWKMSTLAVPVHPGVEVARFPSKNGFRPVQILNWPGISCLRESSWEAPLGYFCAVLGPGSQPQAWSSSLRQPRWCSLRPAALTAKAPQALGDIHDASSVPRIVLCGSDPWALIESVPFAVLLPLWWEGEWGSL